MTDTTTQPAAGSSLFDRLYNDAKAAAKGQNATLIKSALKRSLQGYRDNAIGQRDSAQLTINQEIEKLNGMDVNKVISQKANIKALNEAIVSVQEIYSDIFGTEMPSLED